MTKTLQLTKRAEHSLSEIVAWTDSNFGRKQADAYGQGLLESCESICSGVAHTRSCRDYTGLDVSAHLRFARYASHHIFFVETDEVVTITDFLHVRIDLFRRLTLQEV